MNKLYQVVNFQDEFDLISNEGDLFIYLKEVKPIAGGELPVENAKDFLNREIKNNGWSKLNRLPFSLYEAVAIIMAEYTAQKKAITGESEDVRELLQECEDYFEPRADADHNGENFVPNREMVLLSRIRKLLTSRVVEGL